MIALLLKKIRGHRAGSMSHLDDHERCIVCDRSLTDPTRYARVEYGIEGGLACLDECITAFQRNPAPYLFRREARRMHAYARIE